MRDAKWSRVSLEIYVAFTEPAWAPSANDLFCAKTWWSRVYFCIFVWACCLFFGKHMKTHLSGRLFPKSSLVPAKWLSFRTLLLILLYYGALKWHCLTYLLRYLALVRSGGSDFVISDTIIDVFTYLLTATNYVTLSVERSGIFLGVIVFLGEVSGHWSD